MKRPTLCLLAIILFSSFFYISLTNIINAMKSGNATEVAKYFDETVEITFADKSNSYSKQKAEQVIRDFFTKNSVSSFDVIHQSKNDDSQYCIGNLITKNGTFRTMIYVKQKNQKQVIQELRFGQ
jgi:hypothetical protein